MHQDRDAVAGPDWRSSLIERALDLRSAILTGQCGTDDPMPCAPPAMETIVAGLGPMAAEAIQIVEAYVIGSVSSERQASGGGAPDSPPSEFALRLNIILNGLEPAKASGTAGRPATSVIQSELWQLLFKVRESAEMAYARELDLIELDRRILFLLHNLGPLVPAGISAAVGVDKAQVSRSVKRLLEIRLVEREQLRSPLSLTRKGQEHAVRLLRLADLRNRELTFDIGDAELARFFNVIEKLLEQSVLLYEQERSLSQGQEPSNFPRPGAAVESEGSGDRIVMDRSRIISPLMTLSSYFSRSGSLTFKRLTGLSSFEAWVLNEIGLAPPIDWHVLVDRIDRDHSQAGRTVNALIERGLVEREGGPGRRHGRFSPTEEGARLFNVIQDASRQRSAFLLGPLSETERDEFLATFDKIRRNAVIQLERERAYEELGHR
ncbi:MarR family transcriptional regulator [Alteraurantiacibacter buctensis]|uniref:Winged helix DNA-binding protein n=1 Tax=Alteraurantiacibacter buctensis TaxID=1503981 RepID=A0A844Z2Y0_9SPHN|nr:winged helix DNA-binding protein [Alteraurantiacibacter buctensis]